eukprot:8025369-Pyramimonas_sp.AAC.1
MALWHDSGSSRCNGQVDPWRWTPENNVLACLRVLKGVSSNEAAPRMTINRCRGLRRGSLEG